MARTTYPRDRFDDLAPSTGRVGAHRAENPRMRGGMVFLWAAVATVVLVAAGIFGSLVMSGRISLAPEPVPTTEPVPVVEPVVDTTFPVLVLNATPQEGLATQVREDVIAAGWSADAVTAGAAGATDFPTTTVYYAIEDDEAAALGLAETIGGAEIALSDQYLPPDDPETEDDDARRQLTVVIGLDRAETPAA
ncbi:LytR C-terminal domain-containing protein [Microbacterium lushaniae]|uniref:LytR family transcriptional regulator n=1 Tax=Microbacterium lushaniae TaxID=2614639 RepID=A0A5J6L5Z9_9MICO|nr:LytR C-terminal domain-containing protein [Microbacterium lushaniae]QEW03821.1 LytR family transcriptional regulator [Microbacterium lushaniae]